MNDFPRDLNFERSSDPEIDRMIYTAENWEIDEYQIQVFKYYWDRIYADFLSRPAWRGESYSRGRRSWNVIIDEWETNYQRSQSVVGLEGVQLEELRERILGDIRRGEMLVSRKPRYVLTDEYPRISVEYPEDYHE